MKIIWRKLVFLTIYPYICNRLFELCRALYITVEDRLLNRSLLHFIIHLTVNGQLFKHKQCFMTYDYNEEEKR